MRAVVTIAVLALALAVTLPWSAAQAQDVNGTEAQILREEIRRLNERLNRLEQAGHPRVIPAAPAPSAPAPPVAPAGPITAQVPAPVPGEKETDLGLPKPELGGARFTGFFLGSANFNSHAQIVPEFAGGAQARSEPGSLNFRFDKFGLGVSKTFADWLYASVAVEIESHRDKHSHLIDLATADRRGCPTDMSCERFGTEDPRLR